MEEPDKNNEEKEEGSHEMLVPALEALIFASGAPISIKKLASALGTDPAKVKKALELLRVRLDDRGSGVELAEVGSGYQLRTKEAYSQFIKALQNGRSKRLSPAALETLAVIAYRQPIVKSDIEAIRGVDATPTLKTLLSRRIIKIVGHKSTAGQPALYGTTDKFLEMFGLKSLSELPSLRDLKDLEEAPEEIDGDGENMTVQNGQDTLER